MNPKVSIIIPVYNGANYLREAIDSALKQTYENIEVIVVNDGSKDNGATEEIALSYGDKIKYIAKENGGVSSALNRGINEMTGDYFSWLSHDDLYTPQKIQKQVELISSEKDIIICSGYAIDDKGTHIGGCKRTLKGNFNGVELFKKVINGYGLNGLGFLIPKSMFQRVGLFDESMRYLQDFDLWLRSMWNDYNFVCQDELLVASRVHIGQTTNVLKDVFYKDRVVLMKKHYEMLMNTSLDNKNLLFQLYLLLSVKSNNEVGKALFGPEVKKQNPNKCYYIRCYCYKIYGIIKKLYVKVREAIFKIRKLRN